MPAIPDINNVVAFRKDCRSVFVLCEQDGKLIAYATVSASRYELGSARPVRLPDWSINLISQDDFQIGGRNIGDIIWFNNQYQILVGLGGDTLPSISDAQLRLLKTKNREKQETIRLAREERELPQKQAKAALKAARIEETKQVELRRLARIEKEERDRQKRELQEQNSQRKELEKLLVKLQEQSQVSFYAKLKALSAPKCSAVWVEQQQARFNDKLTARAQRLYSDEQYVAKYPDLLKYGDAINLERRLQNALEHPSVQWTQLVEIELDQAIKHETRFLTSLRRDAQLLESWSVEQKQQAVDRCAAQYKRTEDTIDFKDACTELETIKYHIGQRANHSIIRERIACLRSRCQISQTIVPTSSPTSTATDGAGATAGAIVGSLMMGLFGGPAGLIVGAIAGGLIGNKADHSGSSPVKLGVSSEHQQWTTLLQGIDETISKLPQE